jgi:hypothetical protein
LASVLAQPVREQAPGVPLCAVIVRVYVPPVAAAGVPASVAVPSPLSVNVTPPGNAPVWLSVGFGNPVVVTANVPALPAVKVMLFPLVMTRF